MTRLPSAAERGRQIDKWSPQLSPSLMHTNLWFWIAFNAGVLCLLAIDLFGFQRKAHAPSTKEAAIWTDVWVALSLGFNAMIWYWEGHAKALEFLAGYLVEYSLSVDNIFVFVLV